MKKLSVELFINTVRVGVFSLLFLLMSGCSDWRESVDYDYPIWSDKGEKIVYHQFNRSSKSSYISPGPGGDEVKEKSSIVFTDAEFNVLSRIVLYDGNPRNISSSSKFYLQYFSEYESYAVYRSQNGIGSNETGVFKIMDLNGNELYKTSFLEQKQCADDELPLPLKPYIPALIPSPTGRFVLNAVQLQDCSVVLNILDAQNNFSLNKTVELPTLFNGKIAWSVDENIIVQSTIKSDKKVSWKWFLSDELLERYDAQTFNDECFTPPTASHFISRDLNLVYIDGSVDRSIVNLAEVSEDITEYDGQLFYGAADFPLNVFGCEPIK